MLIITALLSCMHSLDNSGLVLDVDHESSSITQLQANASCGDMTAADMIWTYAQIQVHEWKRTKLLT